MGISWTTLKNLAIDHQCTENAAMCCYISDCHSGYQVGVRSTQIYLKHQPLQKKMNILVSDDFVV